MKDFKQIVRWSEHASRETSVRNEDYRGFRTPQVVARSEALGAGRIDRKKNRTSDINCRQATCLGVCETLLEC